MLPLLIPLAPHLVRAATSRRPQQQPQSRPTPQTTPTPAPTPTRSTPLDIALRAGPAFAGHIVGSRMDLLTAPARAINPAIPRAREEFAARPVEMVRGGLIGASLIAGVAGGAALLGGGGAVAAAGPAASGIIRTGGGAAMGFAARTAPTVVQQGATVAATAAGATLPLALANEITPTFPDPGPQFPTGRPEPEVGPGRNPYILGPDPAPRSTWEPGQAELGTGERITRLTIQIPQAPAGTHEITLRNDLAEIRPRADAWGPGGAELLNRPQSEARFRFTEAIPGPAPSPFGGPSAFPDAFPNVFPTGPSFITNDRPTRPAVVPETPLAIEDTIRYVYTPMPKVEVRPDVNVSTWTKTLNLAEAGTRDATADMTADLFLARATTGMTADLFLARATTGINLPETAYPDLPVLQNPPDYPVELPPNYPVIFPPDNPVLFPPYVPDDPPRRRSNPERKKKGSRGGKAETAFWENLRVATPQEFLGIASLPRQKPRQKKRRKR